MLQGSHHHSSSTAEFTQHSPCDRVAGSSGESSVSFVTVVFVFVLRIENSTETLSRTCDRNSCFVRAESVALTTCPCDATCTHFWRGWCNSVSSHACAPHRWQGHRVHSRAADCTCSCQLDRARTSTAAPSQGWPSPGDRPQWCYW